MNPILPEIHRLQWSLRANRALHAFSKALFVCLVCECAMAVGFKVTFGIMPDILLVLGVALPAAAAAASVRHVTPALAAAVADRELRLQERLSTSLEIMSRDTPMARAQIRDAARALGKSDIAGLKRLRQPRELYFAFAAALVLAAILVAPDPVESRNAPSIDAGLKAHLQQLEAALRSGDDAPATPEWNPLRRELEALLEKTRQNPEAARALLQRLTQALDALQRRLEDPALSHAERAALDRAVRALSGAGSGLASEIGGEDAREFFQPGRRTLAKLESAPNSAPEPFEIHAAELPASAEATLRQVLGRPDWPPQYNPIVNRFFGVER